jgi:hypothetical protein
MMNPEEQRGRV